LIGAGKIQDPVEAPNVASFPYWVRATYEFSVRTTGKVINFVR